MRDIQGSVPGPVSLEERKALLLSVGLHGLAAALLVTASPPREQRPSTRGKSVGTFTTVELRALPRPPPPPPRPTSRASTSPPPPAPSALERPSRPLASILSAAAKKAAPAEPQRPPEAPAAGLPNAMEAPLETTPKKTPGARIDLFPQVALCQAVGCKRDSAPASGTDSQTALNEDLELRAAESAVKEGRVEPLWLEVERDIEKRFAPNLSSVSSASRGEMALRQLLRPGQAAPDQSQTGWLVREYPRNRLEEEIRSGQDAYDKAAVGREAEVEAEIDAEGNVVALRLILHSGSPAFDREAIRAVQQALRARPLYDPESPHGTVLARYVLRGEVAVNLPHITPAAEPNAGSAQGATFTLPGSFDEVTGKVSLAVPSTKRLKTAVHLLSVRRRTPTTPKP